MNDLCPICGVSVNVDTRETGELLLSANESGGALESLMNLVHVHCVRIMCAAAQGSERACWSAKVAMMNSGRDITAECFACGSCGHCRHDHNTYAYSDTGSWCRFCDCYNPVYPRLA